MGCVGWVCFDHAGPCSSYRFPSAPSRLGAPIGRRLAMKDTHASVEELIRALRSKLRTHPVRVPMRGRSMLPTIRPGERVVIVSVPPSEVECGAIVLFIAGGRTILHRVIYKEWVDGEVMFLTRGDNCQSLDNWVLRGRAILGVARFEKRAAEGE